MNSRIRLEGVVMTVREYIETGEMAVYLALFRLLSFGLAVGPLLEFASILAERLGGTGGWEVPRDEGSERAVLDRARRAADRASRAIPGVGCLHRSTGGRVWLARRGVESEIVVGFRDDTPLEGHAWLECGGDADAARGPRRLFEEDGGEGFRESFRK